MRKKRLHATTLPSVALLLAFATAHHANAQVAPTPYPHMAPINLYLMPDRSAEIALARTAAPASISRDAEILVLTNHGFETAIKGTNGFVCVVGRGWTSAADPDYWNPKVRVPLCVNPAAARSYLVHLTKETEWGLAGRTPTQLTEAITAALAKRELPPMEPGAMCYMMGKQGYGGDVQPHWPSHLMFFFTDTDPATWGANQPGSPIIAVADPVEHLTQFVIPVQHYADGTEAPLAEHHHH